MLHFALAVLGIALAGAVDFVTGYEVRTYPLYFLPIAYGALRLPRRISPILAVLSATVWFLSNRLAGASYTSPYIASFNFASQTLAFGLVGFLIAELRVRLALEASMSRQDALTGLPNTRGFLEQARLLLAVARRAGTPVTFAYLDLDNFKAVNDQHGHLEGDRVLTTAAAVLQRHCRTSDAVGRLGGDEFVMLLVDSGPDAAYSSLARIRELMVSSMRANGWPVTVSVGAACYVRAPATLEAALHGADELMYAAKRDGKNRVHVQVLESQSSLPPAQGEPAQRSRAESS